MPRTCTPTVALVVIVSTAACLGAMVAAVGVHLFDRLTR